MQLLNKYSIVKMDQKKSYWSKGNLTFRDLNYFKQTFVSKILRSKMSINHS
jgi:hypothetical protein